MNSYSCVRLLSDKSKNAKTTLLGICGYGHVQQPQYGNGMKSEVAEW